MRAEGPSRLRRRAFGVAAGLLLDRALGEPPTAVHPVVWFGRAMGVAEKRLYGDDRRAGVAYASVGVALGFLAGAGVRSAAIAVGIAAAGRSLRATARRIENHLLADDVDHARAALPGLVGRDPKALDASGVSAAVVESLAENSVDAVVAPAFWGLVAGAPGALAYRCVNTMDAMVGHRNPRYEKFGWGPARLDDIVNLVPARLFAGLVMLCRPRQARRVLEIVRRDAAAHPSPNAGVAESAVAAALGRRLGGPLRYGSRNEVRPDLGDGPRPDAADIARARRLVNDTELALVGLLLLVAVVERPGGPRAGVP
jgi:adenosylcobinamide-phosphate synthase